MSKYQGDPIIKSRLEQFRKKHKKKCAIIPRASDEEKSKMKVIGNDKDILNDAIKQNLRKSLQWIKNSLKKEMDTKELKYYLRRIIPNPKKERERINKLDRDCIIALMRAHCALIRAKRGLLAGSP